MLVFFNVEQFLNLMFVPSYNVTEYKVSQKCVVISVELMFFLSLALIMVEILHIFRSNMTVFTEYLSLQ